MKTKFPNKRLAIPLVWWLWLACGVSVPAIELLSVVDPSVPRAVGGNGDSTVPFLSSDGRFVLFVSTASDLVALGTNAPPSNFIDLHLNVFLRDRSNAVTTQVSLNLAGTGGGNADSVPAGISSNGRYALFESGATDLVMGDDNAASDVFLRDLQVGTNLLISVATNGLPGNGDSYDSVMTPDGRFVAFTSAASDLVPDDDNDIPDVFVRDRQTGTTTLVSVGAQAADGYSATPQITPDGRYVVFFSTAINLVPDVPPTGDIYARDLALGTTTWVSADARSILQSVLNATNAVCFGHAISGDGKFVVYEVQPNNYPYDSAILVRYSLETGLTDVLCTNAYVFTGLPETIEAPRISSDGRWVAYAAKGASSTGSESGVYVWDAFLGSNLLASCDLTGAFPSNTMNYWPVLTPDGRFLSFQSTATNLVTNVVNGDFHLYVRDLPAGVTRLADRDTNGAGSALIISGITPLSDDGRWVAFEAQDSRLVPNDINRCYDVFVRDMTAGSMDVISPHAPTENPQTPNGSSSLALSAISADARFVAFTSAADDLVPNDTNGCSDIFLRDRVAQKTFLVSVNASGSGPGNTVSSDPVLSADGRYVAFASSASDLVAGDTNKVTDVFVRDMLSDTAVLASVSTNGTVGNGDSYLPLLSSNGRVVLFRSSAGNLAQGGRKGNDNLYWRDLEQQTTYKVYAASSWAGRVEAAMTPDGRFVVYADRAGTWSLWDAQSHTNIYTAPSLGGASITLLAISPDANRIAYRYNLNFYLFDRAANTTGLLGVCQSASRATPRFSADGRYLAYLTSSVNVPTDLNGLNDVYLYDCVNGTNTLVSHSPDGKGPLGGDSDSPDISADGRWVAYRSAGTNLVPFDLNGAADVFLWDRLSGATRLLSVNASASASANDRSLTPFLSADGSTAIYASWASDLVPGDFNQACDLFAISLAGSGTAPAFRLTALPGAGPSAGIWLSWPILPNKTFQVQFKNAMGDPSWQTLAGGVTIVGGQGYLNDTTAPASQRFYRVLAQ
jgi:Tol biopolymer transport system component